MLGNVLKIKPVIELKDGILVKLGVARGMRKGKDFLFREYEACEIDEEWPVVTGYTYDRESGEKFRQEVQERYHLAECPLWPVGGVIGTHVGRELPGPGICQKGTGLNAIEDVAFCKKATSSINFLTKYDDFAGCGLRRQTTGGGGIVDDQHMAAGIAVKGLAVGGDDFRGGADVERQGLVFCDQIPPEMPRRRCSPQGCAGL